MHSEAALRAMSEACQPQASLLAKQKEMLQSRLDYTGQVTPNPRPEYNITRGERDGVVHHVVLALHHSERLQATTRSCPCQHCRGSWDTDPPLPAGRCHTALTAVAVCRGSCHPAQWIPLSPPTWKPCSRANPSCNT